MFQKILTIQNTELTFRECFLTKLVRYKANLGSNPIGHTDMSYCFRLVFEAFEIMGVTE